MKDWFVHFIIDWKAWIWTAVFAFVLVLVLEWRDKRRER